MSVPTVEVLKERFIGAAQETISREGINELLEWLEESDFYTAPASTRYHGSYEGGLVEHSLTVFNTLLNEMEFTMGPNWQQVISMESAAIVALFHDICKVGRYTVESKWRKDENGQWEEYFPYVYDSNHLEMGHGSLSMARVMQFIKLTEQEQQAIYWHMGAFDTGNYNGFNGLSKAFEYNQLAFLLHVADYKTTYIAENEFFLFGESELLETNEQDPEVVEEQVEEEVKNDKPVRRKPGRAKPKTTEPEQVDGEHSESNESDSEGSSENVQQPAPSRKKPGRRAPARSTEKVEKDSEVQPQEGNDSSEEVSTPAPKRRNSPIRMPKKQQPTDAATEVEETPVKEPEVEVTPEVEFEKAYMYHSESDTFMVVTEESEYNELLEQGLDEVTKEEYEEYMVEWAEAQAPLEEDFFYKNTVTGEVGKVAAGEILPYEYDEETWEPIWEEDYLEASKPKAVKTASRRTPRNSGRPAK